MLTASGWKNVAASATLLLISAFALTLVSVATQAQSPSRPDMKARIDGLVPELEHYLQDAMVKGHVPGVAVGIVTGDQRWSGLRTFSRMANEWSTVAARTAQ
jgi:hypothetical protein